MSCFAAVTSSFQSSGMGWASVDEIISSSRSMASVRAALKARALASIVAYSLFGICAIVCCNLINFSAVSTSDCFMGSKAASVSTFSAAVRGVKGIGAARDLFRD